MKQNETECKRYQKRFIVWTFFAVIFSPSSDRRVVRFAQVVELASSPARQSVRLRGNCPVDLMVKLGHKIGIMQD
jgi:hypothetical protein